MGFVSPQEAWQKTVLKDEFDKVFEEMKSNGVFEFIDSEKVYSLYQNYKINKLDDWSLIWRVYLVYKWKNVWKLNEN